MVLYDSYVQNFLSPTLMLMVCEDLPILITEKILNWNMNLQGVDSEPAVHEILSICFML